VGLLLDHAFLGPLQKHPIGTYVLGQHVSIIAYSVTWAYFPDQDVSMKALVAGATGLVGRRLVRELEEAAVLVRDPARASAKLGDVAAFARQPQAGLSPPEALSAVDDVFHLAGEPVAGGR